MMQSISREQYVRIEIGLFIDGLIADDKPLTPVDEFIVICRPLIVEYDKNVREYIQGMPETEIEPTERDVLLSTHLYRAEQVCRKLELLEVLLTRAKRLSANDSLLTFRILGVMGSVRGELQAMEKRIF